MIWPLWVLAALSPSLLLVLCAWLGQVRDRRRERAMRRHPSIVGRELQEQRVVREAEDLLRSTQ